jgi:hypothetical protein
MGGGCLYMYDPVLAHVVVFVLGVLWCYPAWVALPCAAIDRCMVERGMRRERSGAVHISARYSTLMNACMPPAMMRPHHRRG